MTVASSVPLWAQSDPRDEWAAGLASDYAAWGTTNLTYRIASNVELKLDLYAPQGLASPNPTVINVHGGGWVEGTRESEIPILLPYLARGFTVVNVGYRLGRVAPAPAAVEDLRCALRFLVNNAERFKIDRDRIVTTGGSAGGHLALTTALLTSASGFDATCPTNDDRRWTSGSEEPALRVAAVVNWFGITDVADLLEGPHAKHYAIEWLGARPNRRELAQALSPLTMVRRGATPVLTIHGDADELVPYTHAVRLHEALDKAGVPNRLITVSQGGHGGFSKAEMQSDFAAIFSFLGELGLLPRRP